MVEWSDLFGVAECLFMFGWVVEWVVVVFQVLVDSDGLLSPCSSP